MRDAIPSQTRIGKDCRDLARSQIQTLEIHFKLIFTNTEPAEKKPLAGESRDVGEFISFIPGKDQTRLFIRLHQPHFSAISTDEGDVRSLQYRGQISCIMRDIP